MEAAEAQDIIATELHLCRCGQPQTAYRLILDVLRLLQADDSPDHVEALIGSAGAAHLILGAMTDAHLIAHGGNVYASFLDDRGKELLDVLAAEDFRPGDGW